MDATEAKRRGRPPAMSAQERRRRIVAAAEETFTSKGYAAASVDDVVRACGLSKKTVYEAFGTKEQLFKKVVASSLEDAPDLGAQAAGGANGEALLRDILRRMAAFILSPRQMALTRIVVAESLSTPELGTIVFETSVLRGQAILAETIRRIGLSARTACTTLEELADRLVGGLLGPQFFSIFIGRTALPTQDELHAHINWVFDILGPALGFAEGPKGRRAGPSRPHRDI